MKLKQLKRGRRGMTLIELSVAILVLLMFVGLLLVVARAWKRGSDRAACLMNIRQVQLSLRGFTNSNGMSVGDPLFPPANPELSVIGPDNFVQLMPRCPAGGLYTFSGPVVPPIGTLFMTCSLAASDGHEPEDFDTW